MNLLLNNPSGFLVGTVKTVVDKPQTDIKRQTETQDCISSYAAFLAAGTISRDPKLNALNSVHNVNFSP